MEHCHNGANGVPCLFINPQIHDSNTPLDLLALRCTLADLGLQLRRARF